MRAAQQVPGNLNGAPFVQEAHVPQALQVGMRVTLHMGDSPDNQTLDDGSEVLNAEVVSPDEPRRSAGLYWGYTTRIAQGISAVFSECPFQVCIFDIQSGNNVDTSGPQGCLSQCPCC